MFQSAVIHAEYSFTNHNAVVNSVCYNRQHDCFVSSDNACLRLWSAAKGELRRVELLARTSHLIQTIEYIEARQLYVAAALDGTLKLYDTSLNELASIFTGRAAIVSLVVDATHNRVLAGGVDGCTAWLIRGRPLGAAENGVNPHYELSPLPTFFSSSSTTSASLHTDDDASASSNVDTMAPDTAPRSPNKRKPSSTAATTKSHRHPKSAALLAPHRRPWVQKLQLSADRARLFVQSKQCIDVFSTVDGQWLETFSDLFPKEYGAILAFVLHEKTQYVVCGCLNGWIFVVSLHPVAVVHVFKDHTLQVTGLAVHASSHLILSSSLDGTVRLWDLEARRQAHRLDIGQPVYAIELLEAAAHHASPCRFSCRVRSEIQLYRIQSTIKEHLPALAPICVLQRVLPPRPLHDEDDDLDSNRRCLRRGPKDEPRCRMRSSDSDASSSDEVETNEYDDDDDDVRRQQSLQMIVAAGMDKTIRLFAGRTANEAPSFTWIPEETTLDVIGFALHSIGRHLFLLLESQKLVVVDVSVRDKETSPIKRIVDMRLNHSLLDRGSTRHGSGNAASRARSLARTATMSNKRQSSNPNAQQATDGATSHSSSPLRGNLTCLCVCYYPPIFRAAPAAAGPTSASATAPVAPAAQSKWFSRTFVNRRQPSAVGYELKRLEAAHTHAAASAAVSKEPDASASTTSSSHTRRNALVGSKHEWLVCGSELGQLLFWHTDLASSRDAMTLDAHDAAVQCVATSTASPLLVSLDAAHCVHVWQCQPLFRLRHIVRLRDRPSCFVLAPWSEHLLSGYDDGSVVLMDVRTAHNANVQTFANDDDNHFAMVSAGDFLDERALVLTASVDAVVKVWDHERTLLRQLTLAMAFTSLCFMNARGDVMAGLANGIFIVAHDDVLPETKPKAKTKAKVAMAKTVATVTKHSKGQRQCDDDGSGQSTHKGSGSSGHGDSDSVGRALQAAETHDRTMNEQQQHQPNDDSLATIASLTIGRVDRLTATLHSTAPLAPSSTSTRSKKPVVDLTKWLTYEDRPLAPLELAPVLRPLPPATKLLLPETTEEVRAPSPAVQWTGPRRQYRKEPPCPALPAISTDGKEADWRDQFMPLSPYRLAIAAGGSASAQRHLRRKVHVSSTPHVLQTLNQSPRSPSPLRDTATVTTATLQDAASGLVVGGASRQTDASPLQYCKHQAPVPPKDKTPRKLWNAIGGEDRRLIVLQRNIPQF